jgi:hypothetical protein
MIVLNLKLSNQYWVINDTANFQSIVFTNKINKNSAAPIFMLPFSIKLTIHLLLSCGAMVKFELPKTKLICINL